MFYDDQRDLTSPYTETGRKMRGEHSIGGRNKLPLKLLEAKLLETDHESGKEHTYMWSRYIPLEKIPHAFGPTSGILAVVLGDYRLF